MKGNEKKLKEMKGNEEMKVNDNVRIINYRGILNPSTIWIVLEIRDTLCLVRPTKTMSGGLLDFQNELWVEVDRLKKVNK